MKLADIVVPIAQKVPPCSPQLSKSGCEWARHLSQWVDEDRIDNVNDEESGYCERDLVDAKIL
jgi:hypothetical protein